jgi:hypothetical protein
MRIINILAVSGTFVLAANTSALADSGGVLAKDLIFPRWQRVESCDGAGRQLDA